MAVIFSTFSIVPAIVAAILKFRKNPEFRPFAYLVFLGAAVDFVSYFVNKISPEFNNLWLINIYLLLEFYLIIYQLFVWKFITTRSFSAIGALLIVTVLWAAETWNNGFDHGLDKYSLIFSGFVIVIFITVFINRLVFEKIPSLIKDPKFVISIGILIYFTTSIFVYSFYDIQAHSDNFSRMIWNIHNYFNIFTNLIYAVGFLCIQKR
jgi:uncharacterized membrane protein AbrB (regulator of aidB expression)